MFKYSSERGNAYWYGSNVRLHRIVHHVGNAYMLLCRPNVSLISDNTLIICTSWIPVEGKSSVCLICMKYRIIFV